MLFSGEAETVDRVGSTVRPLTELLRGLGEGHVGCDGAVDDGLKSVYRGWGGGAGGAGGGFAPYK